MKLAEYQKTLTNWLEPEWSLCTSNISNPGATFLCRLTEGVYERYRVVKEPDRNNVHQLRRVVAHLDNFVIYVML